MDTPHPNAFETVGELQAFLDDFSADTEIHTVGPETGDRYPLDVYIKDGDILISVGW